MKTVANKIKALWNDESAQGATEYILLLVVVVGLAVMFGPRLKGMMDGKMKDIESNVGGFSVKGDS